jgi:hypothetical protein
MRKNLRTYCAIWRADALICWPMLRAASGSASVDHLRRYNELFLSPQSVKRKGNLMSANNTFLAVFLGSKTNPRMTAWNALPEAERLAKQQEGIAAWKAWAEKHQAAIVGMGGPLGKTKKISQRGIEDTSNDLGAYMVVRADSPEAAAKLFEGHPHFTIFPGERVEIMPVLPIPGA